ncbi:DUF2334 domain-containing protein, partial [Neobacillus sp. MM2021_6]
MKIDLKVFKSFMKFYYNWRYWRNLYKSMMLHSRLNNTKKDQSLPYINKPGIAFSFDDSYRIYDWYKYGKDLFGYYDVKVTFNINAIHHFEGNRKHTQNEIDKLLELQSNGHEIAHHGYKHRKATDYSNEFGINKWVEDEIVTLFNWMENQSHSITKEKFKKPVSFAFPHFVYNVDNIKELIPKYFKIVRGQMFKDNLTSFNHTGFAPSICLDAYYSFNLYYVKKMMKIAKKSGRNLIITCHSILPKEIDWDDFGWGEESIKSGTWRTTPTTIQAIIDVARKNDMEFYTTSEVAGIATFIDPNFEKYVRTLISNLSAEWIPISELILIKELDLSNKGISNLDGIQY